ncbi:MAG: TAXI family TRAP transporter solute-binding subunit, partial [Proteobacteria bacterium]|nr:TAXI family TRAP transporter solute-binding subunit [Pseudomonadota bacterium]
MRNSLLLLFAVLACVLLTWGTSPTQAADESFPKVVSLGTGSVGGGYNMVGVGAAKVWDKNFGLKAKVAPGVAVSNLLRFAEGRLDIIVSPSSFSKAAWGGLDAFGFSTPIKSFRVLTYIFPDHFHFVALKKSGLKNVSDLKGKRVGCGPRAPTYDKILGKRLEANGIKYFGDDPDIKKTFTNYNDLARLLADGNLDATIMGVLGIAPFPALQKLMEEKELVALEWSKAALDYEDPIFPVGVIKKELVPYLDKDHYCVVGG